MRVNVWASCQPWELFTTDICLWVSTSHTRFEVYKYLLTNLDPFGSVQRSLAENELTVLSIFVNPAQFAPHEDLATYPRTLPGDLELLTAQQVTVGETVRKASAVFLPSVQDMYPSGISQDVSAQKGAFVEMKGYGHQMEGASRPTFFRGVVTVVTKLFNAVQVRWPLRKTQLSLTTTVAHECVFWPERYPASLTSSETLQGPAVPTP
jgi:hypothetical protein